ncbi:hypothetical protein [Caenispirillum salinarum]|uniref:hypothetical protein n=1 Tax=Caenispirillum salinarum TaxID=859058 RepID=UPI00384D63B4
MLVVSDDLVRLLVSKSGRAAQRSAISRMAAKRRALSSGPRCRGCVSIASRRAVFMASSTGWPMVLAYSSAILSS